MDRHLKPLELQLVGTANGLDMTPLQFKQALTLLVSWLTNTVELVELLIEPLRLRIQRIYAFFDGRTLGINEIEKRDIPGLTIW